MQTIYIPIGLPGCGKTTLYETHLKGKGVIRISADDIRFRKLDSEVSHIYFDESIEKEVWDEYYHSLSVYLEHGASVYCDCTNLTLAKRMKIYESIIKNTVDPIQIIYLPFEFDIEKCWNNQKNRERKVTIDLLITMQNAFERVYSREQTLFTYHSRIYNIYHLNQIKELQILLPIDTNKL